MHAALWGRAGTVSLLLHRGASINAVDEQGSTALLWSQKTMQGRHVESVRTLLASGADVSQPSRGGWTPLLAAALGGATDCAEVLIAHGADVNAVNGFDEDGVGGNTALIYAVVNSRTAMIDLLLRSGADVNARGLGTRTPLELSRRYVGGPGFDDGIPGRLERVGAV